MHNFLKKLIGGKKQDDLVVQHEHTIIVDPAVAPTCTAEGLTEGSHCSICREVLVPQQAIPATGHHYDATVTDPTCTAGGFTVYKCSACGDTYTADETAAHGHTEVIHAAIAPKCTKDGLTEGTHCSVCKKILIPQRIISATGHCYSAVVTQPSCTIDGFTTYTCSVCGDTYIADKVHAKGHDVVVDAAVAPTCVNEGLTEGEHCSICGEVITTQKAIPTVEHNYVAVVTEPSESTEGFTTYTCVICGDSYIGDIVPPYAIIFRGKGYKSKKAWRKSSGNI